MIHHGGTEDTEKSTHGCNPRRACFWRYRLSSPCSRCLRGAFILCRRDLASEVFACGMHELREFSQRHAVIISGDPVGADEPTASAAMEQGHLLAMPDPQTDGIHDPGAEAPPVAHGHIYVKAAEAMGTVVSLIRAKRLPGHSSAAVGAEEGLARPVQGSGVRPGTCVPGQGFILS